MGRPSAINREVLLPNGQRTTAGAHIIRLVAQGVPPAHAAQAAGIPRGTLYAWLQRGRARKAPYAAFHDELRDAEARSVAEVVLTHRRGAMGQALRSRTKRTVLTDEGAHEEVIEETYHPPNLGALQWWLERRFPADFGQVIARDTGLLPDDAGDQQGPVVTLDPVEARREVLDLIAGLADAPG